MAALAALSQPVALRVDAVAFHIENQKRRRLVRRCALSSQHGREMILIPGCRRKCNPTTVGSSSLNNTIDFEYTVYLKYPKHAM
jgi:hypothetical protein